MRWMLAAMIAVFLCLFVVAANAAAFACGKRSDLLAKLLSQHSEVPVAIGLSNTGGVIEVLASPDGATFTIIMTQPGGVTCLLAAGEYWETVRLKIGPSL